MFDYEKLLLDYNQIKPGCKILVRADLNLTITSDTLVASLRIERTIPLIKKLINYGAHVTLLTHLGQPSIGFDDLYSTRQLVPILEKLLKKKVIFNHSWPHTKKLDVTGALVLSENVRFLQGEIENTPSLASDMAAGYDLYILEAFASAHRMHASNYGVMDYCKSYLGPMFVSELQAIQRIKQFKSPKVAIIGGGKSSSKLVFVKQLVKDFDVVLLGGQMANLFMVAEGLFAGDICFDSELVREAKAVYDLSKMSNTAELILPKDLWVSSNDTLSLRTTPLKKVTGLNIVDIGPMTANFYNEIIQNANSILQNGPMGIIENNRCFEGTRAILKSISESKAVSILGGGDTNDSIRRAGIEINDYDFVSTGGGAMLFGITHDYFPAVERLKACLCE